MIRVAFDTTALLLGGGGVATYTRELRDALALRADVEVVELAHARSGSRSTARRIAGGLDRETRWYRRGIEHEALAMQADLIHIPASLPVHSRALPLVLTIHDAIPWRHPEWFTRANALQQRLLVGRAARAATRIITVSASARSDLIETLGLQPNGIEAIHEGISPAFSPECRDTAWLERRFSLSGPILLSVGTPEPRKNLATTLRVYARVHEQIPTASLLLVGGHGWRNADLEEAIARTPGRVVQTGHLPFDDLVRAYASADCLLFPSLMEGFGFPPLEAMASGVPVVCSDRPSLPEIVGDAARTCPPLDESALAAACIELLQDASTAEEARRRGLAHVERFTWEATAEQTVAAYRRALA